MRKALIGERTPYSFPCCVPVLLGGAQGGGRAEAEGETGHYGIPLLKKGKVRCESAALGRHYSLKFCIGGVRLHGLTGIFR